MCVCMGASQTPTHLSFSGNEVWVSLQGEKINMENHLNDDFSLTGF